MNNKEELKPCPFCGGEAKETNVFGRIGISCEECGVMLRSEEICRETGYGSLYQTWNHRTPAPLDDQRLTEIFGKPVSFLPECIYQNSNLGPVTCEDTENENSGKPCSKRCKTPTPYSSTDKRLTEIQARADKATGEPWDIQNKQAYSMPILCDNRGYYVAWINNAEFANTDADGDFMAHARQDIPYLMKDNAQLRSALSAARAEGEAVAETRARVIAAEMLQPALKSWKEKVAGLQSQLKEASAEGERLKGLNESYLDRASRVLNKEMDERNDLVAELIDEAERLRSQLTTAQEKVKRLEEEKESLGQCATKNCDCTIDVVYCTKCRKDWES